MKIRRQLSNIKAYASSAGSDLMNGHKIIQGNWCGYLDDVLVSVDCIVKEMPAIEAKITTHENLLKDIVWFLWLIKPNNPESETDLLKVKQIEELIERIQKQVDLT